MDRITGSFSPAPLLIMIEKGTRKRLALEALKWLASEETDAARNRASSEQGERSGSNHI